MVWKQIVLAVAIGVPTSIACYSSAGAAVNVITEKPEAHHVPSKLILLQETPFYSDPDTLSHKPDGVLTPQTVEVVEGEPGWMTNANWFKINTWLGERWIYTYPSGIDVNPPETVTLLSNTPIYSKPDETTTPTAVLSPQDVKVTYAESQWFLRNSYPESPKWLKIQTSWVGEQWIHLPFEQIGTIQKVDRYSYHLGAALYDSPIINPAIYPPASTGNASLHEIGEFATPAGTSYKVETEHGAKWTMSRGRTVIPNTEPVPLKLPTPLFDTPWPYQDKELKMLEPQILTPLEKIEPEAGLGNWMEGVWYHVREGNNEGWINKKYADPEDAKSTEDSVKLGSDATRLFRFPGSYISLDSTVIAPQVVQALAYWDDPSSHQRWYQIDSFMGKGWFPIDPNKDRILIKGRENDLQVARQQGYYAQVDIKDYQLYEGDKKVGFALNNQYYYSLNYLASRLSYRIEGPNKDGIVTLRDWKGYSFEVHSGEKTAQTLWNESSRRTVPLRSEVQELNGELYLSEDDMSTMLGANVSKDPQGRYVQLSKMDYDVKQPVIPESSDGDEFKMSALLYDTLFTTGNNGITIPFSGLFIYDTDQEENFEGANAASNRKEPIQLTYESALYDYEIGRKVKPGLNQLTLVFKIGERILWQQNWELSGDYVKSKLSVKHPPNDPMFQYSDIELEKPQQGYVETKNKTIHAQGIVNHELGSGLTLKAEFWNGEAFVSDGEAEAPFHQGRFSQDLSLNHGAGLYRISLLSVFHVVNRTNVGPISRWYVHYTP
ncbi:hypothetical protein [Paenibacillus sp. UNC451MF]|uniref:hypothetical protein n=1 Tax=Paenibacillus sp. UNC451MF TaxID=1449063 RepID=UPI00048F8DB8|nr:hypothetical protein [Paenibacillus sp. UNC451MF]